MSWNRVKWTEAGQIAERLEWKEPLGADATTPPEAYFATLRQAGRLNDAVFFLGQALPRFETVAWAARAVRDLRVTPLPPGPDAEALKATLLWVQDPSENRRRTAFDAAGKAPDTSAERLAAFAAFFSGGSIAPPDCPAVQAPPDAAGRFAAVAVVVAAIHSGDEAGALTRALDAGALIAQQGLGAAAA